VDLQSIAIVFTRCVLFYMTYHRMNHGGTADMFCPELCY